MAWTGEAGDAAGARDQFAALLPVIERVFGPEHRETQEVRDNLIPLDQESSLRARRELATAGSPMSGKTRGSRKEAIHRGSPVHRYGGAIGGGRREPAPFQCDTIRPN